MSRKVQVIGAHSADFVWRAGGAVAKAVENGGTAEVIALSYGERGESGELWKQEGQTVENVKSIRHDEAEAAARARKRRRENRRAKSKSGSPEAGNPERPQ